MNCSDTNKKYFIIIIFFFSSLNFSIIIDTRACFITLFFLFLLISSEFFLFNNHASCTLIFQNVNHEQDSCLLSSSFISIVIFFPFFNSFQLQKMTTNFSFHADSVFFSFYEKKKNECITIKQRLRCIHFIEVSDAIFFFFLIVTIDDVLMNHHEIYYY